MQLPINQTHSLHRVNLVFFAAGGLLFAVESTKVRRLDAVGTVTALDLTSLLNLPHMNAVQSSRVRLLHLVHPRGQLTVRVTEPIVQEQLPLVDLYPLPPLLAARQTLPAVRAMVRWRTAASGETLAVLLDPSRFPDEAVHS